MSFHYLHNLRSEMQPFIPVVAERILDVGCNTGAFGEGLKARGKVVVWGIEPNKAAATKAASLLDYVINDTFSATTAVPDNFLMSLYSTTSWNTWWTRGKRCALRARSFGPVAAW